MEELPQETEKPRRPRTWRRLWDHYTFGRYPCLRRNLLICLWVWFSFAVGFYGVVYNTPPLGYR